MLQPSHMMGDPHTTAYNEGKRTVALHILQKLNTNEKDLIKMINRGDEYEEEIRDLFDLSDE
jgi:hypothetical protein